MKTDDTRIRRLRIAVVIVLGVSSIGLLAAADPVLVCEIKIPEELLAVAEVEGQRLVYGGDIRLGDLNGDGRADFVVFRSSHEGMKPSFLGAFTAEGNVLWRDGVGGDQPARPGAVTVYDFDGDGEAEVLNFFQDSSVQAEVPSMENVVIQIRRGATGEVLRQASPGALGECAGSGPNWVHQRLLIANLRGTDRPGDFVVKIGDQVFAFDDKLHILWRYRIPWNEYSECSAYIPAVGDLDGDGRDEVTGGYYLLDDDGTVLWEKKLGRNMDSVAIVPWDAGQMRIVASGGGYVLDAKGEAVLCLGEDLVPHGQEVRVGDFISSSPGPEMIIRWNGHERDVMAVGNDGTVLQRFLLNPSPNHTGMEAVLWNGPDRPALLYDGGVLWNGDGKSFAHLPGLPEPVGPERMGWYHCIPADVSGDSREEVVLYNPWASSVWIYSSGESDSKQWQGYRPGPRQYNVRLMD